MEARRTCEGVGYSVPPGELPETTAVKLYGFLLKCDRRRALAAGELGDSLSFPPSSEGREIKRTGNGTP